MLIEIIKAIVLMGLRFLESVRQTVRPSNLGSDNSSPHFSFFFCLKIWGANVSFTADDAREGVSTHLAEKGFQK